MRMAAERWIIDVKGGRTGSRACGGEMLKFTKRCGDRILWELQQRCACREVSLAEVPSNGCEDILS